MNYATEGVLTPLNESDRELYEVEARRVEANLLHNQKAKTFLAARNISPDELLSVLPLLIPIDGARSNLAVSECGIMSADEEVGSLPLNQYVLKSHPNVDACCGIDRENTRYNIYFFRRRGIQAMHILHELLHATLNLDDVRLANRLGFSFPNGDENNTGEMSYFLARECLASLR